MMKRIKMKMSQLASLGVLIALLCLVVPSSYGQSKSKSTVEDQAQAKQWAERASRLALAEAKAYEFRLGKKDGPRLELVEKPILKWSNSYEAAVFGSAFVWTHAGRPEVVACIFKFYTTKVSFDAEFHSLAEGPLIGIKEGEVLWQPSEAGTSLKPLEDAPAPAKTATARLVQMRDMARNFSGQLTTVIEPRTKHGLRLLPQPLMRYGGGQSKELVDGALFAFARATDPEVILMLEARGADTPRWEYAVARMHVGALSAAYRNKEIWSVEELKHPYVRKNGPYTLFQYLTEPKID
jgi:hypothetical protein